MSVWSTIIASIEVDVCIEYHSLPLDSIEFLRHIISLIPPIILNCKNFNRIFLALNNFRHHRRWELNSDEWYTVLKGISEDIECSFKIKNKSTLSGEDLTKWLLQKFDFDFVKLTELDIQSLKVI